MDSKSITVLLQVQLSDAEREATIYRSRRTLAPDVILFDYSPPITIIVIFVLILILFEVMYSVHVVSIGLLLVL